MNDGDGMLTDDSLIFIPDPNFATHALDNTEMDKIARRIRDLSMKYEQREGLFASSGRNNSKTGSYQFKFSNNSKIGKNDKKQNDVPMSGISAIKKYKTISVPSNYL